MKRREFLKTVATSFAAVTFSGCEPLGRDNKKRPNIIVIIGDDMGYSDIGCYGCKDIPTPNIDSIARKGVRFTNAYVTAPGCSPSRAGIMTGRYQQRFGHYYNPGPPPLGLQGHVGLPITEITIADVLKSAGYTTGAVGKWHLGLTPHFHPLNRGFDEFYGFLHGKHSYTDPGLGSFNPIMRGTTPVDEKEYLTDAFTREATSFIKRHRTQPFFLLLAYNAPHTPLQAPKRFQNSFEHIKNPKRRTYAAMLAAVDEGIGKVLTMLQELELQQDTLLFFINDNGGWGEDNPRDGSLNKPLRGGKGSFFEGGIRVPFMVQWPSRLSSGRTFDLPVISLDILPTISAVTGAKLPSDRIIDGVNLIPFLSGKKDLPHQSLFWFGWGKYAIREGNWKLVNTDGNIKLFDLAADIAESHDLSAEHPDVVKHLAKAYEAWNKQMIDPVWSRSVPKPKPKESNKNVVESDTGLDIQSDVTYTIKVKAKSSVGSGSRITLYCWCGFSGKKDIITSADYALTSSMEEISISFDSDSYAGRRLIFGYKFTAPSSDTKFYMNENINVTHTKKQPGPDPSAR